MKNIFKKLFPGQGKTDKEMIGSMMKGEDGRQLRLLNQLKPKPGQKIFGVYVKTGEAVEAKVEWRDPTAEEMNAAIRKGIHHSKVAKKGKLVIEEDFFYCVALNKRNAEKKFLQVVREYYIAKEKLKTAQQVVEAKVA